MEDKGIISLVQNKQNKKKCIKYEGKKMLNKLELNLSYFP